MIAVLATKDPHGNPFWIGKVIKIEKENDDVIEIEVYWYETSMHPFNGVYKVEMVVGNMSIEREKERVKIQLIVALTS
jgi:hypothetical protein